VPGADGTPLPARLYAPATTGCRCCCTCTAAASSSAGWRRTTACAASWRCAAAARCWRWTTGWRPSTASRRRRRHLGRAALAGRQGAQRLGLDGSGWPSAATAPAARWPRWRDPRPRHRPAAGAAAADHARHRGTCRHAVAPAVRQRLPARRRAIEWFFDHYIDRHHRSDWRFAPLKADDLDGVAPACLLLAECDPLVDEGLAYADRLRGRRAGGAGAGTAA
jgi:hypothetical protein